MHALLQNLSGSWAKLAAGYAAWGYYYDDALVGLLLIALAALAWSARGNAYWRRAWRSVRRNRMAMASLVLLGIYGAIGFADAVGWHPARRDEKGAVMRSADGRVVYDAAGITLLDRLLTRLRKLDEKTYSAPLAAQQFTAEIVIDAKGAASIGHPPLNHPRRHILGTDLVGQDVLYLSLKSIRTGIILGGFTTLLAIPFAIVLGVLAGYFGGWIDDAVQYIYTVLSSIPSVLLVVAFMVIYGRSLSHLCLVLGITSWTGLCRVLRGETLKLRESDFVQASLAMGTSRRRILWNHVVPNVLHIVLITVVLNFSGFVLAEAALTFIGIGLGAETYSWGHMISDAQLELARDPVVWWKLIAAFIFMLGLVLPANTFGDALRDALDPRLRTQ